MTDVTRSTRPAAGNLLYNRTARAIVYQVVLIATVILVGWWLVDNTLTNLAQQNIATGFDFLVNRQAGFAIGESVIPYNETDSYLRAFIVGLLNTIKVAVIGVVLATILGTIIGIARLSPNWLLRKLSSGYVEIVRNIPLLLQLIFWYAVLTEMLPAVRNAIELVPTVFLSNRGLFAPAPVDDPGWWLMLAGIVLAIPAVIGFRRRAQEHQDRTGVPWPTGLITTGIILGLALLGWLIGGAPTEFSAPELRGFNFSGGTRLTPEFLALLLGLTIYTAGFIAEIVRSGILAISHGQTEAAMALGLNRGMTLRLVILPQAMRVIVPPMTSQYLNLTKNSSLAIAIGYPDLVSSMNTSLNQTGQAIECIAVAMSVYLIISLSISFFMNWYNARIALKER
ncbi:MAG: amino acid ABC transporter permease [Alphaproteobacteria bacterium]